jgi:predicted metal-binding protein
VLFRKNSYASLPGRRAVGQGEEFDYHGLTFSRTRQLECSMDRVDQLVEKAKDFGATAAAAVKPSDIRFSKEFRTLCEQNSCGKYATNWMCPPAVGSFDELRARVLEFSEGVVFQTVHNLDDPFDLNGMTEATEVHDRTFHDILKYIRRHSGCETVLALNAGECRVCRECTYPDGAPCRFPDRAVASLESYCIDVAALLAACDIPYNNGPNTVSLVGVFLFDTDSD